MQTAEIGLDLAHARMRRQQRRRQLRQLPLQAHALLHQVLDQRGFLHVGQRLGRSGAHQLAHGRRSGLRLAARGLGLGQLGGELAELLLVEAGIVGTAFEDVGFAPEALDRGLGLPDLLHQFVDPGLQSLLHLVGLGDGARRQRRAIDLGQLVGDGGCELGVFGGEANADEAALLRRIDVEPAEIRLEDAILLALAAAPEIESVQNAAHQSRRRERAVELRLVGEALVGDDLDGEIRRHQGTHVSVDGFLVEPRRDGIDRCVIRGSVPLGSDELELRLGGVFRRDERQNDVGGNAGR